MASEPRYVVLIGALIPGCGLVGTLHTQGNREGRWIDLVPVEPKVVHEFERDGEKVAQLRAKLPPDPTFARHLPSVRMSHETIVGTIDEIVERFRKCLVAAAASHREGPCFEATQKAIEEAGIDSFRIIDSVTP
jgi:hypothetical protein